jgi:hypothetical protein
LEGALREKVVNDETDEEMVEAVNDEARSLLIFEHMECRDTQISCIAARSLVEPPEACQPQEGLKSEVPRHPEILVGPLGAHRIGRPSFPT